MDSTDCEGKQQRKVDVICLKRTGTSIPKSGGVDIVTGRQGVSKKDHSIQVISENKVRIRT